MNFVVSIFLIIFFLFKPVDCTVLFSNDSARIIMSSGSEIRFNPPTIYGWNDRSLIKNLTGAGLGDYNLVSYSNHTTSTGNFLTYSAAPGELVYDNSNAIVSLSVITRTNSNAFLFGNRNNSNAIVSLSVITRTNSNAFLFGNRNNSNAIIKLGVTTRTNSNAMLLLNRTTSNAMLFGNRNNSNSIVALSRTSRTNSNAFAYGIKNNSNAIIYLGSTGDPAATRNNSNSIVALSRTSRTNSNAFAYEIKNNSNAIIYLGSTGDPAATRNNSNSIVALSRTSRTNSNAFAYEIKNNSNAIIYLGSTGDPAATRNNSNAIVALSRTERTNSNAFAYEIKNNSNAIIKLSNAAPSGLLLQSSNAIVALNAEMQTIDHGPENIIINTPTYTMDHDIYLSNDHMLQILNSCEIDGNGHTIYFPSMPFAIIFPSGLIQITNSSSVLFKNVTFKNYNDNTVSLDAGSKLIFGGLVNIELDGFQELVRPWVFSPSGAGENIATISGGTLSINTNSIQVSDMLLLFQDTTIGDLAGNNLFITDNSSIAFYNTSIYLANDYTFTNGAMIFAGNVKLHGPSAFNYASTGTLSIAPIINPISALYLTDGITFNYTPPSNNRNLIQMDGAQSTLYLQGCTLASTTTGMQLINGSLIVDGVNYISNNATSLSEATCFGNGIAVDNLNINIMPGGSLNILSGILDYQNTLAV